MRSPSFNHIAGSMLAMLLVGCGTPPAKDFGGRWISVNRFQPSTTEIPLNRPYTYYASPMDETLRNMLQRWVTDTGMTLVYRLPSDYTLFAPVTKVRTSDIRQAAAELNTIYAAQGVSIDVQANRLQVGSIKAMGSNLSPLERSQGSRPPEPSSSARSAKGAR